MPPHLVYVVLIYRIDSNKDFTSRQISFWNMITKTSENCKRHNGNRAVDTKTGTCHKLLSKQRKLKDLETFFLAREILKNKCCGL